MLLDALREQSSPKDKWLGMLAGVVLAAICLPVLLWATQGIQHLFDAAVESDSYRMRENAGGGMLLMGSIAAVAGIGMLLGLVVAGASLFGRAKPKGS